MSAQPEPARPRPTDLTSRQLGFTRAKAVGWLSPSLLTATAVRVLGSHLFGAYLDKRELQGVLASQVYDHSSDLNVDGEFWLDYVGDLGDGFDATYSIAWLLGQPELDVRSTSRPPADTPEPGPDTPPPGPGSVTLPRGHVLVLGGDQVYPTPSSSAYEHRFRGPYRCALPVPRENPPSLYALPGNHDWYDGLTAFLRVFAKDGWIGGWRTRQSRSYFALQLPHHWWIFAVDTQVSAYIDHPQLAYFLDVAKRMGPEDRVLVCLPQPAWIKEDESPGAYDPIDFFLRKVIAPSGASCSILLTGDLHHYARYERVPPPEDDDPAPDSAAVSTSPVQLVTCGGGGAYLSDTARLPDQLQAPAPGTTARNGSRSKTYRLAKRYPSKKKSRRYSWGVFGRLLLRNPGFGALIGLIHTVMMLAFHSSQYSLLTASSVGISAFVLASTIALARKRTLLNRVMGFLHGAAHIGLGLLGTVVWSLLPFDDVRTVWHVCAAAAIYGPVLAVVGTQLVAAYLLIAGRFSINVNELFAGQGIQDSKCFLRIRIASDGTLTLFPIAVDRICHRWKATPDDPPHASWIAPRTQIRPRLIEEPVDLKATTKASRSVSP